jgi:hypothetical protein
MNEGCYDNPNAGPLEELPSKRDTELPVINHFTVGFVAGVGSCTTHG